MERVEGELNMTAWMAGGVWGRIDTCIYVAESLRRSPETITNIVYRIYPNTK